MIVQNVNWIHQCQGSLFITCKCWASINVFTGSHSSRLNLKGHPLAQLSLCLCKIWSWSMNKITITMTYLNISSVVVVTSVCDVSQCLRSPLWDVSQKSTILCSDRNFADPQKNVLYKSSDVQWTDFKRRSRANIRIAQPHAEPALCTVWSNDKHNTLLFGCWASVVDAGPAFK